ncbi:hypothetical protein [Paracoccus spongiarum]|uniref:DUF4149 domain-containing protein n=1 Tax=Paracoccus spongiarum TaxID=3064387 RepID=A0ABT9JE91_9RHOB|nr:hypothetical protein [Paracoccus sp. 2205BS29-5]MDP5308143.1 hypothetical protein [Paracoccus sp. 2205BS29-5]
MIVPALILAILSGTVAAAISLIADFGWVQALVAYWVAGNIALMLFLIPRLISGAPAEARPAAPHMLRPAGRLVIATGWVTLGLAMVFWQSFHNHGDLARAGHPHEIGSLLGMQAGPPDDSRYLRGGDAPGAVRQVLDHLLRLDIWIAGVLLYLYGTARLLGIAAAQVLPGDDSRD